MSLPRGEGEVQKTLCLYLRVRVRCVSRGLHVFT